MKPAELLGTTFPCECGRTHAVPVRAVVYAGDALAQLPALLDRHLPRPSDRGGRRLGLAADARTWPLAGRESEAVLRRAGWEVTACILPDGPRGHLVCDDQTRDFLDARLPPGDALLACGSGTISDLVKWLARDRRTPYAVAATAASMNGYASSNIAPTIRGVKRVLDGTVPGVILADPETIRRAPPELTGGGFGDVLAKPVSLADWKLNALLLGEYYCPLCARLIRDLEPGYLARPAAVAAREPAAIESLFQALIYSGVSMTMAGTSFPASGGEHLVSHALDMIAAARGRPHDYHGRQVGLGTIVAAALYERLLALESPDFRLVTEPTAAEFWTSLAAVVEEEHDRKRRKAAAAVAALRLPGAWDRLRTALAPMLRPAAEIKRALRAAGGAHRIADIGWPRDLFLEAVRHCHQMRERYTVIDLARAAGILPAAAAEIAEQYLA